MQLPIHRWFRFSAGYSAKWVEHLLQDHFTEWTTRRPIVLDPFTGSGTTLLAASVQGSRAYGWESQPFIYRVARAKIGSARVDPKKLYDAGSLALETAKHDPTLPTKDEHPLLEKCYHSDALGDLRRLQRAVEYISATVEQEVSDLLWLALVSILRPTSHVGTAQWQYIQPNKTKTRIISPFSGFEAKLKVIGDDILRLQPYLCEDMHLAPLDARTAVDFPPESVDVVITSPPYANNFDYADATRLEMTFLGDVERWSDLRTLRNSLVHACSQHMAGYDSDGALRDELLAPIRPTLTPIYEQLSEVRHTRGGKKAYHAMIVGYFHDMAKVWKNLRSLVRCGGSAYFVVGDSAPYGVYVPVDTLLGELAVAAGFKGFEFTKLRSRNTKWKNRKHRVPLKEGILEVQA